MTIVKFTSFTILLTVIVELIVFLHTFSTRTILFEPFSTDLNYNKFYNEIGAQGDRYEHGAFRIAVFGSSISIGEGIPTRMTWPYLLQNQLEKGLGRDVHVDNLSVGRLNKDDLLKIVHELERKELYYDLIIFQKEGKPRRRKSPKGVPFSTSEDYRFPQSISLLKRAISADPFLNQSSSIERNDWKSMFELFYKESSVWNSKFRNDPRTRSLLRYGPEALGNRRYNNFKLYYRDLFSQFQKISKKIVILEENIYSIKPTAQGYEDIYHRTDLLEPHFDKTSEILFHSPESMKQTYINLSRGLKDAAATFSIPLFNPQEKVFQMTKEHQGLLEDEFHFSKKGHEFYATEVYKLLKKVIRSQSR